MSEIDKLKEVIHEMNMSLDNPHDDPFDQGWNACLIFWLTKFQNIIDNASMSNNELEEMRDKIRTIQMHSNQLQSGLKNAIENSDINDLKGLLMFSLFQSEQIVERIKKLIPDCPY